MLKLHGLSLLLQLALTAPALASLTSVNESSAEPLRIAFAPHPFLSHWAVSAPIAHELLQRGHKALFVASTEDWCSLRATGLAHHPNVSVATYQAPYSESHLRETINGYRGSPLHAVLETFFNIRDFSDAMLTDRRLFCQVQAFDADLLVADPGNLGGWALADALDIHKAIVQVPGFTPPLDADLYGHGGHSPAFVPTFGSVLPTRMTLTQRCQNVGTWALVMVIWRGFINWFASYHIWWKHNIAPHSYRESGRRSCLVLVNSHFALAPPRPLGPKVHVVGPLTAKSPEPLPADLEAFMQSAGQFGVVYASLGYTAIPERHELQAVADALAAVAPVSVLWKLTAADQQLLGVGNVTLSHNIRLIEWAPQNDVLGHPATRAFLTQAGTNSFNEAAYHGVPIVGLPLFAEQPDNMARATEQGFGLSVSVDDALGLSQNLRRALLQILQNPSFAENANRVSRRIRATHWSPASQAASGSAGLKQWLADEAEQKKPEFLKQRPKYFYYYEWMKERICETYPALPELVMDKLLTMPAGDLDLILQHPQATTWKVDELMGVLEEQGPALLERYPLQGLTWEQVKELKGPNLVGLGMGSGPAPGEGLVEMGLDRHEQLKLEMQKQYLLGQGLPEGHKGSTCRHQDNPNAMDDGVDDEDLEDIE